LKILDYGDEKFLCYWGAQTPPVARLFFQKKNGENFANISLLFRISSDLPPVSMGRIGKVCGPPMEEVYKDQSLFEGLDCPGLPPQKRTPVLLHVDMIESSRMIDKIRWILIGHFFVLFPWVLFVWKAENGVQQNRSLDNYRGSNLEL